jgi:hypothetical protein
MDADVAITATNATARKINLMLGLPDKSEIRSDSRRERIYTKFADAGRVIGSHVGKFIVEKSRTVYLAGLDFENRS